MKFSKLFLLALIATVIFSCKDSKTAEPEVKMVETGAAKVQEVLKPTTVTFNDPKIAVVYDAYNALRVALVNTDANIASNAAVDLSISLKKVEANEAVVNNVSEISKLTDIENQRKRFEAVSTAVEKLVTGNIASGSLYKQYCPMAFGNKGASWLSDSKEIRNPYFGDKMLKCGRVDAEIK
ncbi:hypothetical protein ULMS_09080 [Patiriisocius marinistellae]|uniref:DUF3347 domain-containing protein n=1 Tax=Patiriisocius marinistellae TaxID=2494560 RepID=A0A5J4FUA4_9FLAO|nr:DUF3347 domain-containing protein [Patiriisocius marinistellae]GEQ85400.1 hypothetical protein ULMS_09080 [Patiriisocius marinistellae]